VSGVIKKHTTIARISKFQGAVEFKIPVLNAGLHMNSTLY